MEKYIISDKTLAILKHENGSIIIEKYRVIKTLIKPTQIIDYNCKYFGSSIQGRNDSTNFLIGVKQKCPIIISEILKIIMFPTKSFRSNECEWINLNAIKTYSYNYKKKLMEILLINDQKIYINMTKTIFSYQIFKASRLENVMNRKII